MTRKLRWVAIAVGALVLASMLSVYSYGRFAEHVRGTPSQAIPVERVETAVDRAVVAMTQQHPGQAGLSLISDNLDAFAIRTLSAGAAGRSLDLQYYIWKPDVTGNLIVYELLRAADRGVRVRLLLDDLNAHDKDSMLAALDRHRNIEVRLFNPSRGRESSFARGVEMLLRGFSLNRRMHNKAWIVDGRLAIVGGRNIGDEYFGASSVSNFLDADLAVVGPPVQETEAIFDAFWNSVSAIPLAALADSDELSLPRLRRIVALDRRSKDAHPYLAKLRESGSVKALLRGENKPHWTRDAHVHSDPPEKAEGAPRKGWLIDVLAPAAMAAQRELHVVSPYFVPGDEGVAALLEMRKRGVQVSVVTNSLAATDVAAVHGGYARYRLPLLEGGVELYELMAHGGRGGSGLGSSGLGSSDASLHTKALIIDGSSGFIGSFNIDPRSINLNTEMGILFKDRALCADQMQQYARRTRADTSYRLWLESGELRWRDGSVDPPRQWTHEPAVGVGRRMMATVIGWLPVESQL